MVRTPPWARSCLHGAIHTRSCGFLPSLFPPFLIETASTDGIMRRFCTPFVRPRRRKKWKWSKQGAARAGCPRLLLLLSVLFRVAPRRPSTRPDCLPGQLILASLGQGCRYSPATASLSLSHPFSFAPVFLVRGVVASSPFRLSRTGLPIVS